MYRPNPKTGMFLGRSAAAVVVCAMLLPDLGWAQAAGQWRDAKQMYAQTCAYCHGAGVAVELLGSGLPPEYIASVIRNGLRAMPAFRPSDFNDADIAALVEMITASPAPVPPRPQGGAQ
jgi:4-cresol dehydrogenase (hydroxylating) cytochrome subunit